MKEIKLTQIHTHTHTQANAKSKPEVYSLRIGKSLAAEVVLFLPNK